MGIPICLDTGRIRDGLDKGRRGVLQDSPRQAPRFYGFGERTGYLEQARDNYDAMGTLILVLHTPSNLILFTSLFRFFIGFCENHAYGIFP